MLPRFTAIMKTSSTKWAVFVGFVMELNRFMASISDKRLDFVREKGKSSLLRNFNMTGNDKVSTPGSRRREGVVSGTI